MSKIKIAGLIALGLGLLVSLYFALRKKKSNVDAVTGVSNDKILNAALQSGIKPDAAIYIANAPDSGTAAKTLGVDSTVAANLSYGIAVTSTGNVITDYGKHIIGTANRCDCGSGYLQEVQTWSDGSTTFAGTGQSCNCASA